jgi:hypothetical protein
MPQPDTDSISHQLGFKSSKGSADKDELLTRSFATARYMRDVTEREDSILRSAICAPDSLGSQHIIASVPRILAYFYRLNYESCAARVSLMPLSPT